MNRACQNCTVGDLSHCFHSKCIIADGVERGFLSINYELPGPAIHVCKDDVIVVDLTNDADGMATSIHWHGMRQIKGTQYMDGTPYLTQVYGLNVYYKKYIYNLLAISFNFSVQFLTALNLGMLLKLMMKERIFITAIVDIKKRMECLVR